MAPLQKQSEVVLKQEMHPKAHPEARRGEGGAVLRDVLRDAFPAETLLKTGFVQAPRFS